MPRKVNRRQQLIRLLSEIAAGDVTSMEEMSDIVSLRTKLIANTPAESAPKKKVFKIVKSKPEPTREAVEA